MPLAFFRRCTRSDVGAVRPAVARSSRRLRQGAACVAAAVSVLATSASARAQSTDGANDAAIDTSAAPSTTTSPSEPATAAPIATTSSPSIDIPPPVPQRVVTTHPLNVKRQYQEYGLQVSAIESKLTSRRDRGNDGLDVFVTVGLAPKLPVLRVSGYRGMILRAFDSKSFSFTPFFQGLEGGAHLGIFEVGASAGVSALSVDVAHGDWSFGLLQPRVSALAGLKIQELRLRAVAFSEFYWRWFGEDSAFVRGIGLQLVVGTPNTMF